jgi:hypothetical protein
VLSGPSQLRFATCPSLLDAGAHRFVLPERFGESGQFQGGHRAAEYSSVYPCFVCLRHVVPQDGEVAVVVDGEELRCG